MKRKAFKTNVAAAADDKVRLRVQIESVQPKINSARFPVKRILDDVVKVEGDVFADGHNELSAVLLYRKEEQQKWSETPMTHTVNDRWTGEFKVTETGRWKYTIQAWVDDFKTWQRDFKKRVEAEQDVDIELLVGIGFINKAIDKAKPKDKDKLNRLLLKINDKRNKAEANKTMLSSELGLLMEAYSDRTQAATYRELTVVVDPKIARFSSWYELFPRSWGAVPGRHGTLKDVIAKLPYVADMGFNVLYLPPVHPVGAQFRKGKNNSVKPEKGAVGSPWAIGNKEGGHKAVHPELGTLEDFRALVEQAGRQGISVALDIAFQCSPDHPYVAEHSEWFRKRPDGSIRYAENPPKKYQDIYPLDFETETWQALWDELRSVIEFWIAQGVKIFRVDNPHTKDLSFWEWMINGIKKDHPDVIFLAEAFTRPKLMYRLAKLGFSQSYTYFTWRNVKWELTQYFTELNKTEVKEFFRPNLWPNTPDILTEFLQTGGPNAFKIRYILAATLGANYGIYGPAFELCVNAPLAPKSEEYLDSEKYEIKKWNLDAPQSLRPLIKKVNEIRNRTVSLQYDHNLEFFHVDNESMICYGKFNDDLSEIVVVVVSLDPNWEQSGWIELPLEKFGIAEGKQYQVLDMLDGTRYTWAGRRNFIKLEPAKACAHIFKVLKATS
jgi:starch synthase (maltosyl-transferring)